MNIITAIENYDLPRVIALLETGISPNTTDGPHNYSLLFLSIFYSNYDIFYELINRGADINHSDNLGRTVIYLCTLWGLIKPLTKLLESNAYLYTVVDTGDTCIYGATMFKNLNIEREKTYNLIMFADRANHGDLEFIKYQILIKNYIPIKTWINYLSKQSCLELFNWIKPVQKVSYIFGKDQQNNLRKQNIREQVCDNGFPAQIIMSYLEPKYIGELRDELSIKLS